jgi:hypothetical protein
LAESSDHVAGDADRLDAVLFAFAGLSTLWLAYLLVRESVRPGWPLLLLVLFWVLLTHLLLPRLHRILTRIYLPGYFIGRAHTSDGLYRHIGQHASPRDWVKITVSGEVGTGHTRRQQIRPGL